jgi:threonine dehydrogenase-like Zn-dependent dehydrogenase
MKANVYEGPYKLSIKDKPKPKIQEPTDVVLKITATCICGSDLHLYHGLISPDLPGQTLGHENVGVVDELGPAVKYVKKGDRVVVPFNISCGACEFCNSGLWSMCDNANPFNPKGPGAAFGYAKLLGGFDGGQAEYLRVPYADVMCLKIPDGVRDDQAVLLADIFPTGFFGCSIAGVRPGHIVAVGGCGPVGLMAQMSAILLGAAKVYAFDRVAERLEMAKKIGATPINVDKEDPVNRIMDDTQGSGVDAGVEAVGYEATGKGVIAPGPKVEPKPLVVLETLMKVAKKGSIIGMPGLFAPTPADPEGRVSFPLGAAFTKELGFRMGQCNVKNYNRHLMKAIEEKRVDPSVVITHREPPEKAPKLYEQFDRREGGIIKVLLKP